MSAASPRAAKPHARAFAATLRSAAGEVLGTTWGGTVCWFPRKPSMLAAVSADGRGETVIRCGWCPGCRELDRRRLARRIAAHFEHSKEILWLVIVECPLREQSKCVYRLRRRVTVNWRSGFFRISSGAVALIAAGTKPNLRASGSRYGYYGQCSKIRRSRGLRAWNLVTAGLLRSRDEWGEQRKRFYWRGLAPAERDRFEVTTRGGLSKRHAGHSRGVRAIRGDVGIYPPEAWRPPRLNRRRGPESRRTAAPDRLSPAIADLIQRVLHQPAPRQSPVIAAAAKPRPSALACQVDAARAADRTSGRNPEASSGGRYTSSRQAVRAEIDAWLARMLAKPRGGGG